MLDERQAVRRELGPARLQGDLAGVCRPGPESDTRKNTEESLIEITLVGLCSTPSSQGLVAAIVPDCFEFDSALTQIAGARANFISVVRIQSGRIAPDDSSHRDVLFCAKMLL
jgi:hypothetical protein